MGGRSPGALSNFQSKPAAGRITFSNIECRAAPLAAQMPGRVLRYGSAGIVLAGMFYLVAALHWA